MLLNLSLTSSLYIACNSNPEPCLKAEPAPSSFCRDLFKIRLEVVVFEVFETDSVRSWGTSPGYNVRTEVSAAEPVRCVRFCSGLLWLFFFSFWPENTSTRCVCIPRHVLLVLEFVMP